MRTRPFYSVRTGKRKTDRFDLPALKHLFLALYNELEGKGHFQKHFGYHCMDAFESTPGEAGSNVSAYWFRKLKRDLYTVQQKIENYTEDELFDVLEFLYDHVSLPTSADSHGSWGESCYHYAEFNDSAGQAAYREAVNDLLKDYAAGFELSQSGEVLTLPEAQLLGLMNTELPAADPTNVQHRVDAAIHKFRSRVSSWEDRRDAVRDLADVLEFLRPKLDAVLLNNDERDLFELANRFHIRHHNRNQKTQYDKQVWLSWMFHYYLATIHAVQHLLVRKAE